MTSPAMRRRRSATAMFALADSRRVANPPRGLRTRRGFELFRVASCRPRAARAPAAIASVASGAADDARVRAALGVGAGWTGSARRRARAGLTAFAGAPGAPTAFAGVGDAV